MLGIGEDHIVAYDPMLIDKIEIIKVQQLLYGNNAFAGVVNIINPLINVDRQLQIRLPKPVSAIVPQEEN